MNSSWIPIVLVVLVATACGKSELDPASLTNNPFDPGYDGPAVYEYDTTYVVTQVLPDATVYYQVVAFRVKEELFLADAEYTVRVSDRESGAVEYLQPNPAHSDHFTYFKPGVFIDTEVCIELSLFNNQSAARAEVICATLQ